MNKQSFLLSVLFFIAVNGFVFAESRTWTTADGKHTVEAEFVRFDIPSKTVILKNKDGQEKGFKEELLCADDLDYVKKQSVQILGDGNPFDFDGIDIKQQPTKRRRALLIGVNEYENTESLSYTGNDVRALAEQLKQSGYKAEHVVTVHDTAGTRLVPTKKNILREIEKFCNEANESDMLFFMFSGHGIRVGNQSYLAPFDAEVPKSENDNAAIETLIPVDWVYEKFEESSAKVKIIFLDACQEELFKSDGTKTISTRAFRPVDLDVERQVSKKARGGMIIHLAACSSGQFSHESENLKHGVYTYFLIQGLKGDADYNHDGKVGIKELDLYAQDKTKAYVRNELHKEQIPSLKVGGILDGDPPVGELTVDTIAEMLQKQPETDSDFKEQLRSTDSKTIPVTAIQNSVQKKQLNTEPLNTESQKRESADIVPASVDLIILSLECRDMHSQYNRSSDHPFFKMPGVVNGRLQLNGNQSNIGTGGTITYTAKPIKLAGEGQWKLSLYEEDETYFLGTGNKSIEKSDCGKGELQIIFSGSGTTGSGLKRQSRTWNYVLKYKVVPH